MDHNVITIADTLFHPAVWLKLILFKTVITKITYLCDLHDNHLLRYVQLMTVTRYQWWSHDGFARKFGVWTWQDTFIKIPVAEVSLLSQSFSEVTHRPSYQDFFCRFLWFSISLYIKCSICSPYCGMTHSSRRRRWPMARSMKRCNSLPHSLTIACFSWLIVVNRQRW